jgi:hypothetical protein
MSATTVDSPHGLHYRRRTVGTRHTPRVELPPLRGFHLAVSERDALAGAWRPSAPNGGRATFATQQRVHAAVPLHSARRGSRRQPPQSPARGRAVAGGIHTPRVVRGSSGGSLAGVRWDASAATSGDAAVRPLDTPRHHRGTVPPRPRPPATGRRGASAASTPAEAGGALRGGCPSPGPRPPVYSTRRVLVSSSSWSSSSWRHR